ncbi:SKA complex subunit 1 isoform X2 [Stigmatopora argus]
MPTKGARLRPMFGWDTLQHPATVYEDEQNGYECGSTNFSEIQLEPPLKPEPNQNQAAGVESTQQEIVKFDIKNYVKEIPLITMAEFENIPAYMKGRVSYHQINTAVENINAAFVAKYKIVHQSGKSRSNRARILYQRFKDQETKETRGQYFVVDNDFREFTHMKVDKRLQGILNMLRHCQRLRELRGGGLTRYVIL